MRKVKCLYCGETFDREKIPAVLVSGRRYAHKSCAELINSSKTKEELEYEELEKYIKNLLKDSYVEAKVKKQIMEFKDDYNYSFSGMLKTLIWFYEIEKNSVDKANGGIGIIPFVYNDAYNYYLKIFEAEQRNSLINIKNYQPEVEEIVIPPPIISSNQIHFFKLEED